MNIQRKNSAYHFRMQSEREQTFSRVAEGQNYIRKLDYCLKVDEPST